MQVCIEDSQECVAGSTNDVLMVDPAHRGLENLKDRSSKQGLAILLLGAAAFGGFFWLQFSFNTFAGTDAYYHTKLAALMAEPWPWPIDFPWLPKTVLGDSAYVDHHFLFHVFLAPFVAFDILLGGKFAAVCLASLTFCAFQLALPKLRFSERLLLGLGYFAISPAFLYRLSMVRAQSLSLGLLFLVFLAVINKRHKSLAVLSFVYVWSYNAFPLIAVVVACYALSELLVFRRIAVSTIVAAGVGIVLGMLINPYFPENIAFLYHHLVDKFSVGGYAVKVGNEWYPYPADRFLEHAGIPIALLATSVYFSRWKDFSKQRLQVVLVVLFVSLVFLGMFLKSRRFVELFPPFALLLTAWCFAPEKEEKDAGARDLQFSYPRKALAFLLAGVLVYFSTAATRESLGKSAEYERFSPAAAWLRLNTEAGSLIFTADWDDFPRLFHFNHHNSYLVGLDPYFLYARDRPGFLLWQKMTQGELKGPMAKIIQRKFGSGYIFVDRKHEKMRQRLEEEPGIRKVFEDKNSFVYQVGNARLGREVES